MPLMRLAASLSKLKVEPAQLGPSGHAHALRRPQTHGIPWPTSGVLDGTVGPAGLSVRPEKQWAPWSGGGGTQNLFEVPSSRYYFTLYMWVRFRIKCASTLFTVRYYIETCERDVIHSHDMFLFTDQNISIQQTIPYLPTPHKTT